MARPAAERVPLRVAVDARPLDIGLFNGQGIGRYAQALLGPLEEVARERGGEVVVMRQAAGAAPGGQAQGHRVRRPPLPARLTDWPEQVLLPLDLRRTGARVAHSLSIYRSAVWPGIPLVMTIHDVVPLMWPGSYLQSGLLHRVLYAAARRTRLLLAVSEAARRDAIIYLGVSPAQVLHVPLAADPRFRPSDPEPARQRPGLEGRFLLYVGGLITADPRKNLEGLVDAYACWRREEGRSETLVLTGRIGEAARALEARAARAGAPVHLTGFVPDEELPSLMSAATCLVSASRYEGFGLPSLEAISCGTPVVTFHAGAAPEVIGPGGLLVADGDGEALMRAVGEVCDNPSLRARLAAEGRDHASRFSWQRTAALTWEAYERVAGQTGGSRP